MFSSFAPEMSTLSLIFVAIPGKQAKPKCSHLSVRQIYKSFKKVLPELFEWLTEILVKGNLKYWMRAIEWNKKLPSTEGNHSEICKAFAL